jgi:serine/threonine protein kinase/Tfp pilus assembly protein PilF
MTAAWRCGERPLAEEFLIRLPSLADDARAALQLIRQEILLRQEFGEPLADVAVMRRFPQWQDELRTLFDQWRPTEVRGETVFPEVGEALGDFQLLAELGRGTLGRVFLANQPALADRPVVLKMTPCHGREHLSLARLQHTHIVPLYSVQDYPGRNLRVLCMPYLGGAALSTLLERLPDAASWCSGQQLLQALDEMQAAAPFPWPRAGPARPFLARASYVQAVCWIGACLAEALQYAHERALIHLDLKPSNVLLAADGQPMLLDFHLAREPLRAGEPAPEWLGGTPSYMSPEQKEALAAVRQRAAVGRAVDGRSDIYSLGLLLYEALAGHLPPLPAPLYRVNRAVSAGLSDSIQRCLEPEPRDRYPDAAALALDLRLHLTDQPLRGVRNRSIRERWAKWRRRRPYALAVWALLVAVGTALVAVAALVKGQHEQVRRQVEAAAQEGEQLLADGQYAEAARALQRASALAEGLRGEGRERKRELDARLRLAGRAQAAQELHRAADRVRFLGYADSRPRDKDRTLEVRCRALWDARAQILEADGVALPEEMEKRIRADLLDLALLGSDLGVQLAPASSEPLARREALKMLDEAEALFGPSAALYRARQVHAAALGRHEVAETARRAAAAHPPRTPWEHYTLGLALCRSGDWKQAAAEVEQALRLQPDGFWPHFYQGKCAYRLGDQERAVTAFSVCLALAPPADRAVCYFNRARALSAAGREAEALADYTSALELQPRLGDAALNRGILHYRAGQYNLARADLQRALDGGADPVAANYNLALVQLAQDDRPAALRSLQQALRHNPDYAPARELRERLQKP